MNIIEKLNNIDIKDLQKIDYSKALQEAKKRPEYIIGIALILSTIYFSSSHFMNYQKQVRTVKNTIAELQKKIAAIDKYTSTKDKLDEFLVNLPNPIAEPDFINLLTDTAAAHNIQIETMSPSVKDEREIVQIIKVSLKIIAPSYQDLWLFIYDFEKSPFNVRIDSWSGTQNTNFRSGPNSQPNDRPTLNAISSTVEISLINFKHE